MAIINKYVDPSAPDDSGTGDSKESPKKYFSSVTGIINRSTDTKVIHLRGGFHHEKEPSSSWSGNVSGWNVVIQPYWMPGDDTSSNPILDGVTWVGENSQGWTPEGPVTHAGGGFVWSKQFGAQPIRRVWSQSKNSGNKRGQRVLGPALRRTANETTAGAARTTDDIASIKATLTSTELWYCAGATLGYKLYMWTPDDQVDPAKYHKGLGLSQNGTGTPGFGFGMGLFNSRNFQVRAVDVLAPTAMGMGLQVTDIDPINQNILFWRCKSLGVFAAFKATQAATPAYLTAIDNVEFYECHADPLTSAGEQEPNSNFGIISGTDQYDFRGKIRGVRATRCSGRNPGHAAMNIGSWDSAGAKPSQSGFIGHRVECDDWTTYSRSIGMSLCEPSCFIRECFIKGTNVVGQLAGSGEVVGNVFQGLRKCIRKVSDEFNSYDGWINIFIYRGTGSASMGNEKWWDLKPDKLIFAHNTCDGVYGTPIDLFYFKSTDTASIAAKPQTPLENNAFQVYNNVYVERIAARLGKPVVVAASGAGAPSLGVQPFHFNAFYCGPGLLPKVSINGTTYTNINDAPGFVGNLTGDPRLDSNLKPLPGSPLIRAGKYVGIAADNRGKRFGLKPTIGAYEVDAPIQRKKRLVLA